MCIPECGSHWESVPVWMRMMTILVWSLPWYHRLGFGYLIEYVCEITYRKRVCGGYMCRYFRERCEIKICESSSRCEIINSQIPLDHSLKGAGRTYEYLIQYQGRSGEIYSCPSYIYNLICTCVSICTFNLNDIDTSRCTHSWAVGNTQTYSQTMDKIKR